MMKRTRLVLGAAAISLALAGCNGSGSEAEQALETYTLMRGPLRTTVRESGEIKAESEKNVKSQVEGQAALIYLIPEGSMVEQGDRLAEMDASSLIDKHANQGITVERAAAALVSAQQDMEILEKEIIADESDAESKLQIAKIDLEKFLGRPLDPTAKAAGEPEAKQPVVAAEADPGAAAQASIDAATQATNQQMREYLVVQVAGTSYRALPSKVDELLDGDEHEREVGEMAQQILRQLDEIKLAQSRLAIAVDTLEHSKTLADKDFITRNELDKDQLDHDTKKSQVVQAWNDLDLLISYSLQKDHIDLVQKVQNAELELEKVKASANARRERQTAELLSKQKEYELAKERLDNYAQQIENAVIRAPGPGLVVYSTQGGGRRGREIVEEGMMVRERQTLILLPNTTKMKAALKIPEADIDKIRLGQTAHVKVDAFPDTFPGKVTKVSPLPDSGSRYVNSDLRVYKCEVTLDGQNEAGLRPGMSSTVEIHVGDVDDVLFVPIVAVHRQGAVHYVWADTAEGPIARKVTIGLSNLSHVEITEGLSENDSVFLEIPPDVVPPEFEQPVVAQTEVPELEASDAAELEKARARRAESEGESGGDGRGRGRGGAGAAVFAQMGAFNNLVKEKLPRFATQIDENPGIVFRDQAIQDAIKAHPDLAPQWAKFEAAMQTMRSGGGFGGRGGSRRAR